MTTREQQEIRYWPTVKGLIAAAQAEAQQTCQRSLFDAANDPYNFWRDDQDKPVRRETVPCTCGACPAEEVVHGGLVDMASHLYGYEAPR